MLDPLSALSLASTVIQIADFGCKLVSQTQEIYSSVSGITKDNATIGQITRDVQCMYTDLKRKDDAFYRSSADDVALGRIADECTQAARELLEVLRTLKAPPGATQLKSLQVAIRSALKKSSIKNMEDRLLKIQKQINFRLQKMVT